MLVVEEAQIRYCSVRRSGEKRVLPGALYSKQLFARGRSYPPDRREDALQESRRAIAEAKDCLVVQSVAGYTLWYRDERLRVVADEPANPIAAIDLARLVRKMRQPDGVEVADRTYSFKTYARCFVGREAVSWWMRHLRISNEEAIALGQRLIDEHWIHHVANEHAFRDEYLFYRFYSDEDTKARRAVRKAAAFDLADVVGQMRGENGVEIADRRYKFKRYPRCFVGREAVAWFVERFRLSEAEAIALGQRLLDKKWICHATGDRPFCNDYLFYRFDRDKA